MTEFDWVSLGGLGGAASKMVGKQTGVLTVALDVGEELYWPEVAIGIIVERRPDLIWSELEEQARRSAIEHLRGALEALESASVEELRKRALERRETQQRESDTRLQKDLEESLRGSAG